MKTKFAFILMCAVLFWNNAQADAVSQVLKIKISGIEALEADFAYAINNNAYTINSTISTAGMFGKIYPFSGIYNAIGRIKQGELIPVKYTNTIKSRFNNRNREFLYDKNGHMTYRIIDKNDETKKIEIDPKKAEIGTNLPTVFTKVILQLKNNGTCASTYTVFNGKRHFQVVFEDYGFETLVDKDNPFIDGVSIKCSMHIDSEEDGGGNMAFNASVGKPVMFWVKKDTESSLPYISKIEATYSKFGKIVVYADEVKIKGF